MIALPAFNRFRNRCITHIKYRANLFIVLKKTTTSGSGFLEEVLLALTCLLIFRLL
jgi:hypothetical protein